MLSKEEIQHIAALARLGLNDEELERYRQNLSAILDYVAKLSEVDVGDIEPTSHVVSMENIMRADAPKPEESNRVNKLMEAAPDKKEGYVKVKAVLSI